jgi:hypothetical protein
MTTFAQRVFGRSFGRQPEIEDGIRGEVLVLRSIASLTLAVFSPTPIAGAYGHRGARI